ncbi:DUF1876 domain-containing protein [bacterium]|nr:DUF1876 domain-containing protein [bacterium]
MLNPEIVSIKVDSCHTTKVMVADAESGQCFTGKAKKDPKDEFDYMIGVELAFSRAMIKLHTARIKWLAE